VRFVGKVYRPPSEADALLVQATLGCSWNHCTYCDMYRALDYRVRPVAEVLEDLAAAASRVGPQVHKLFVTDGDALGMPMDNWRRLLGAARTGFPNLGRVSCYAMARNLLERTPTELAELRALGLSRLYIGPESGDDDVLKQIAKGSTFDEHVAAAARAREAGIELSVIFLLGAGGVERSDAHAEGSARLLTAMDPAFASALTLTVVPGTPLATLAERGRFVLPPPLALLRELRTLVALAAPTDTVFRTNHASNYLPLAGRLPADRDRIVATLDAATAGAIPLRPEWARGL
jgi:radical SAM superfamily enzyme YgiQ (UPF0313 family)